MSPPAVTLLVVALAMARAAAIPSDAEACRGQQVSCTNETTILVCVDLGSGFTPVSSMPCPGPSTPFCFEGRCVAEMPTAAPPTTTPRGTPMPGPASTLAPVDEGVCGGRLSVCADCYTRTVCARLGNHVVPVANRTCGADAPYCVEGVCQPDLPPESTCEPVAVPESTFRCYGSGYFPDPANCTKYHLCVADKAYDYDCGAVRPGLVYDHARALCVPASTGTCATFDCRGRAGQYLSYSPDQTLYALCVTNDNKDALVAACPAGHRLQADDPASVRCVPFCAKVGRSADPNDPSGASYFECLATSGAAWGPLIGPLKGTCPQGAQFDGPTQRCQSIAPAPKASTAVVQATGVTEPTVFDYFL